MLFAGVMLEAGVALEGNDGIEDRTRGQHPFAVGVRRCPRLKAQEDERRREQEGVK